MDVSWEFNGDYNVNIPSVLNEKDRKVLVSLVVDHQKKSLQRVFKISRNAISMCTP